MATPLATSTSVPYNDLILPQWRDYDEVSTGTWWPIDRRDNQNGHSGHYHGNCVPQILTQLLTRYTKQGEVVLDLFLGSGTTALEAAHLGRRCVGVDLKPDMVEAVQEKLTQLGQSHTAQLLCANSASPSQLLPAVQGALKALQPGFSSAASALPKAQFLFLHPPYADIIQFSQQAECLSNAQSVEAFLDGFEQVARNGYQLLQGGRYAGLVIGDKYAGGEVVPLGFYCMQRMQAAGFKLKAIIVKNMAGNEKAKGKQANLWRYRALKGGFYVFEHEYVMVFEKPVEKKRPKTT